MNIRTFCDSDWQSLLALYNQIMQHDQIDELFFVQHLLLNPNITPENIFILEDNDSIVGWTVGMTIQKALDCWSVMAEKNRNTGFIMPPVAFELDTALQLIAAAEKFLTAQGCTRIRCGLPGYTLWPNGIDKSVYPLLHKAFELSGYTVAGYSHSMERSLENYSMPLEYQQRIAELAKDGIVIKTADVFDLLPLRKMLAHSAPQWMHLICRKAEQNKLHEMIVVRKDDEILGCCQYNYFGMVDRIGPFRVADSMKGRGIGTLMIARLLEIMAQKNIKHAWFASCVKDLVYFYGKNGLQVFRKKSVLVKEL